MNTQRLPNFPPPSRDIHLNSFTRGIEYAMRELLPAELARHFQDGYLRGYEAGYADGYNDCEDALACAEDDDDVSYTLTDDGRAALSTAQDNAGGEA